MPESKTPTGRESIRRLYERGATLLAPCAARFLSWSLVAALAWPGIAAAWTKQDVTIPASDGLPLAATLYVPDGTAPAGGWPAIIDAPRPRRQPAGDERARRAAFLPGEHTQCSPSTRGATAPPAGS